MSKAMIEGEERERSRLAQELHDGIGGMMAAIQMRLSNTNGAEIQEIKGLVADTANEIRKTAHNLMPDIIQRYGLIDALRIYTANINRSANGLHMELQVHHPLPKLNHTQELSLYRVLQEITHNILKHADATTAIIQISYQQPLLNIIVEDDGKGFHVNDTRMGLGIRNMQLRIKLLNGTCLIESAPNIGTTVNISIPA